MRRLLSIPLETVWVLLLVVAIVLLWNLKLMKIILDGSSGVI